MVPMSTIKQLHFTQVRYEWVSYTNAILPRLPKMLLSEIDIVGHGPITLTIPSIQKLDSLSCTVVKQWMLYTCMQGD